LPRHAVGIALLQRDCDHRRVAGLLLLIVVGLLIFGRSRPVGRDMEQEPAGGQTWPDAPPGDAADPADAGEAVAVDPDG